MVVRSVTALTVLAAFGILGASPALAIDPAGVLAGRSGHGFAGRTARITSIMGPEVSGAAPLRVPTRPERMRPIRRDADALAGLR